MKRSEQSSESKALWALLTVAFVWGMHGVVGKTLEARMDPLSLTVWRYTFTTACYAMLWGGSFRRLAALGGKALLTVAAAGLLIVLLYPLMFYQSLPYLTPIESLVVMNTAPLLAALLGLVLFRERIALWGWIGIMVSFAGVALLMGGDSAEAGGGSLVGYLYCGAGALTFAGYLVLSRKLVTSISLPDMLVGTSLFGTAGLWLLVMVKSSFVEVWEPLAALDLTGWAELAFVVLFISVLGYALNGYGLKRLPSGLASAVSFYPQPIFAALAQWLWLGLVPTIWIALSTLLVFGGVALSRWKGPVRAVGGNRTASPRI